MRLVDGEQGDTALAQQLQKVPGECAFGRHVEQVNVACQNLLANAELLLRGLRRIEECRIDTILRERIDLILHQRDQW